MPQCLSQFPCKVSTQVINCSGYLQLTMVRDQLECIVSMKSVGLTNIHLPTLGIETSVLFLQKLCIYIKQIY